MTDPPGLIPARARVEGALLLVVFVAALGWNLATGLVGFDHALSDSFGFRQTQTALTTWALLEGGPWLAYETPVLGPPWAIPLEFPLYQWLVALLVRVGGLPLEAAGRVVARAFFYAVLPVVWLLLAELRVQARHRLVFLILWVANPYYAFWSRTFLMETTAVFFGVAYLASALRVASRGGGLTAALVVATGSLCAAVKATTFPGFLGVGALAVGAILRRERPSSSPTAPEGRRLPARAVTSAFLLVLPLALAAAWSSSADSVRAGNPLTGDLDPGRVLRAWLFQPGADGWLAAWARLRAMVSEIAGGPVILALAVTAAAWTRRRRAAVAVCLLGFATVLAVFLRFHVVHLYYSCANGLFLIAAVGFGVLALLETPGRAPLFAGLLLALAVAAGVRTYHAEFERVQRRDAYAGPNATVRLARLLAEATSPEDVILGFGRDWSPEVPFYARRRALMWPGHVQPEGEPLRQAVARLVGRRVGAVFVCGEGHLSAEAFALLRESFALSPSPHGRVGDCEVLTPRGA